MESEQSDAGRFIMDKPFELEDFSHPSSPEVRGGFVEHSGPEPDLLELLARGADSVMPKAGAARDYNFQSNVFSALEEVKAMALNNSMDAELDSSEKLLPAINLQQVIQNHQRHLSRLKTSH
ncbi:hypothetical protein ATANTOWER_015684 [Ataeniobius toweri]|uniref:Uncharacterized protein n=1 Tax=Ataeniobius toweri TaxID=208326 RepID=A0ABU7CK92_9TELE|nr:hypothetical protein [Ataeniobius toweri]